MACDLGQELAAFLLEAHAAADSQVRPPAKRPPSCPKCHAPGQRVNKRNDELTERELTTRAGEVKLQREQWRCVKCRIVFFSVRPQAEVRDGEIQPPVTGEGGTPSQQVRLVQGSQ
jgi:hypothetical protein